MTLSFLRTRLAAAAVLARLWAYGDAVDQAVLARQHMAPARGHQMQVVARMLQHLGHAPAVKRLQAVAKLAADLLGRHPLLAGRQLVMLGNVVALQPLKGGHRVIQAGRGHAPGANGGADQMHWLVGLRQPLTKNESVQLSKDQSFGPARSGWHGAHVLGAQATLRQGRGQEVPSQGRAQGHSVLRDQLPLASLPTAQGSGGIFAE
mgnify:CR=1 FL=1